MLISYIKGSASGSALIWVAGLQIKKKAKNFHVLKSWMFFLVGWSLLLKLVRPLWRPRDTKFQFFIKKVFNLFHILVIKTLDSELDPVPDPQLGKMLDPDPHKINADPQPWLYPTVDMWLSLNMLYYTQMRRGQLLLALPLRHHGPNIPAVLWIHHQLWTGVHNTQLPSAFTWR